MYNFTKNFYYESFHDDKFGSNNPKIKGFFIALMVKPHLNIGTMADYLFNKPNIIPGMDAKYVESTHFNKLFKGSINPYIISNLVHKAGDFFSPIISNRIESVSYPDVGSNSEDVLTTLDKAINKLPITETGTSGLTFNMKLRENEGHDVLRMMSVWHKYIHAVTKGSIDPTQYSIRYSIIDYKASLYILHVKPDFRTITMWSKFTGIYPTSIPLSSLSEDIESVSDVTFDVEFSYDKFEWMDEDLLKEINLLTSGINVQVSTMALNKPQTLMKQRINLIKKIKNSPYYHIDLNGLTTYLNNQSMNSLNASNHPAGYFGNSYGENDGFKNVFFAAPFNMEMVDIATNQSISNPYNTIGAEKQKPNRN